MVAFGRTELGQLCGWMTVGSVVAALGTLVGPRGALAEGTQSSGGEPFGAEVAARIARIGGHEVTSSKRARRWSSPRRAWLLTVPSGRPSRSAIWE